MSKIYDLYSPDQRKIDNLKRKIKGYQKMEKDLKRDIRKTNNKNRELQQRLDRAEECIKNFLCSEECIKVDGIAIADNYVAVLEILRGGENNR